jgi:hypothetical protein
LSAGDFDTQKKDTGAEKQRMASHKTKEANNQAFDTSPVRVISLGPAPVNVPYLFCRVCGRKFRNDGSWALLTRVISHLENSHPEEVLPILQEVRSLIEQLRK